MKDTEVLVEKFNSLWVEKYRPNTVEDLISTSELKSFLKKCIQESDVPNILLHGKPGTGKNSITNIILKNTKNVHLIINASEERGIDTIREKVQNFATSSAWGDSLKIVVLNEADGLNYTAQDSLRELMETSSKYCRFILTCNYVNKIAEAIQSRCVDFELVPKTVDIAKRLADIFDSEGVEYSTEYLALIIKRYGVDIRKMINESQKHFNICGKLSKESIDPSNRYNSYFEKVFETNDIKKISEITRKTVFDDDIYSALKDYVISKYDNTDLIIIIAEYSYKARLIADKDLAFLSCLFTLKQIINNL